MTSEEIQSAVATLLAGKSAELEQERYKILPQLIKDAQKLLRWAVPLDVKKEVDEQVAKTIGPKDERDDPKLAKAKVMRSTTFFFSEECF